MGGTNLVDSNGQKIQTVYMPVVKLVMDGKTFNIPIRVVKDEDRIKSGVVEVTPYQIIKEMRSMYTELQDRFVILSSLFAVLAKDNPALDAAMSQMGLNIKDFEGEFIYQAKPDLMHEKAPERS